MNTMENNKLDIFKILIIIFFISLLSIGLISKYYNNILSMNYKGLESIQYLTSQVQRVTKLELENDYSNALISVLNDTAIDLEKGNYFVKSQPIMGTVKFYVNEFNIFRDAILEFRVSGGRDLLFNASEKHYDISTIIMLDVQHHIDEIDSIVVFLENLIIINILIIVGLLFKILNNTNYELYKSKKISSDMFIDVPTGIYNHSKCNEILNNIINSTESEGRAIIVFVLKDFKKMSLSEISYFTKSLKKATKIFTYDIFVGKYDNNLFITYFSDTIDKDVELYMKEIEFLVKEFNEVKNKGKKISYYVGHSIANNENKLLSTQELFDIASFNAYKKNKI